MNMLTINIQSLKEEKNAHTHHNKMEERKKNTKKKKTEKRKKKHNQNRRMQTNAKMNHQTETTIWEPYIVLHWKNISMFAVAVHFKTWMLALIHNSHVHFDRCS